MVTGWLLSFFVSLIFNSLFAFNRRSTHRPVKVGGKEAEANALEITTQLLISHLPASLACPQDRQDPILHGSPSDRAVPLAQSHLYGLCRPAIRFNYIVSQSLNRSINYREISVEGGNGKLTRSPFLPS